MEKDIIELMTGNKGAKSPHEYFFMDHRGLSVRSGDWKYHKTKHFTTMKDAGDKTEPALYNLKQDVGEAHNVIDKYPEVAARLANALEAHIRRVGK